MSLFRIIKHHYNHIEGCKIKIIARCKLGWLSSQGIASHIQVNCWRSNRFQESSLTRYWDDFLYIFIYSLRVLTALTDSSSYSWCWFFALPSKFRLVSSFVSLQTLETLPWTSVYGCTATLHELAPALGNSTLQWCDVTWARMLGISSSGNKSGK